MLQRFFSFFSNIYCLARALSFLNIEFIKADAGETLHISTPYSPFGTGATVFVNLTTGRLSIATAEDISLNGRRVYINCDPLTINHERSNSLGQESTLGNSKCPLPVERESCDPVPAARDEQCPIP